jgi:multiple sugar transport system permease protein
MTGGGPINKTMTVGLDIWYHSFLYLNFGYATAEAWILGAMLIGFTVFQLRILNRVEFKRAGAAMEK